MMNYHRYVYVLAVLGVICAHASAAVIPRSSKFNFPPNLVGLNTSAKDALKPYKLQYDPVDLSIDIYDDDVPINIRRALANATLSDEASLDQLTDPDGFPRLRKALAAMYTQILNRKIDPDQNILVTAGATEAFHAALNGHARPGDEWIVVEPSYLMYVPMVKIARGVPRYTTLKLKNTDGPISSDDWELDKEEFESLFSKKTKGIILNNPLNPLGKVYRRDELEFIADMAKKYNTLVICDEAHEFITHKPHVRIATLSGMFERTITLGTASKSFSAGGWRVGWAYGPAEILNNAKVLHEHSVDNVPTPQQNAVAFGIEEELRLWGEPESYFVSHLKEMREKHDLMVDTFNDVGLIPTVPDGGFCMIANWTPLKDLAKVDGEDADVEFAKWLIKEIGVYAWPVRMFYSEQNRDMGRDYLRFCIHKKDDTLQRAAKRLQRLKSYHEAEV